MDDLRQPQVEVGIFQQIPGAGECYSVGSGESSSKLDPQILTSTGGEDLGNDVWERDVLFLGGEENPLPPAKNVTAEVPFDFFLQFIYIFCSFLKHVPPLFGVWPFKVPSQKFGSLAL